MLVDITGNDYTFGAYPWLPDYGPAFNNVSNTKMGWIECSLRSYLNSTWFNMLPTNIKNAIKPKTSTYRQEINETSRTQAIDNIWIPSIENLTDFSSGKLQKPFSSFVAGPDQPLQYYLENETRSTSRIGKNYDKYYVTETRFYSSQVCPYYVQYGSGVGYNAISYLDPASNSLYKRVIPNFIISK